MDMIKLAFAISVAAAFALLAGCGSATVGGADVGVTGGDTLDLGLEPQDVQVADNADDVLEESDAESEADVDPQAGFIYECETGKRESCVTACGSAGSRLCLKEWGPCVPPTEFCGNCADDDCDGEANEGCPPNPECGVVVEPECPVAKITVVEGTSVDAGTTLHLSGLGSIAHGGAEVVVWRWEVEAPAGSGSAFLPGASSPEVTFVLDVAGQYMFLLEVEDDAGIVSCVKAVLVVTAKVYPPQDPEVGCADGEREGFLSVDQYPQIAGCFGGWEQPGVTPDTVVPTCGRQGGDDGGKKDGLGCSSADLCAEGWHVCETWKEVAAKSPSGCVGAVPADAKSKSIFFAVRQPSFNGSVCGEWGDGFNDVFGCGNLGAGLGPDKDCGPLDRVIASTQPNICGFNEAEPPLGPYECKGGSDSHLNEGALVTKKACQNSSCSYDGYPVGAWEKGGVLCCRD